MKISPCLRVYVQDDKMKEKMVSPLQTMANSHILQSRARIFNGQWAQESTKESILPAYVAWRAGTTTLLFLLGF